MSGGLRIFGDKATVGVQKALAVADFAGITLEVVSGDEKALKAVSPLLRTPALAGEHRIVGGDAIARHLARTNKILYGRNDKEHSEVDSWLDFVSREVEVPVMAWIAAVKGPSAANITKQAMDDLTVALKAVDEVCFMKTFLVGERMTLADVCLTIVLSHGNDNAFKQNWIKENFPNLHRLYLTVAHNKTVAKVTPRKCPAGACGQRCAEKKQQQKQAAPKKEKEPTADDIEKQIEKEQKAKAKAPNPLDSLPPTPLVIDEWKRVYSNTKDLRGVALPWFWEHFDAEGWSFWYMKYDKLEGECTKSFATSNQLSGFLQRIEPAFRKYSFAVNDVVGEEGNYDIIGVWMVRGHEIPTYLQEHPSIEYHKMTKLDHNKPEEKKLIEDYWVEDDTVEGRPIADSKVWK